ncbi:MAG TPA: hypothetical protein VHC63_16775 [Acidimicrobiales bacterium]|nr:hypothetical protein [Acidimicrobiales bacterium]
MGVGALIAVGAVGAGLAVAGGTPAPKVFPGTARIIPGDAAVTVHRGTPVAAADALLRAGDTVSVNQGVAALRTAVGTLYASAGSVIAITSHLPRITRGDVLVQGNDISVAMRAATAEVNGLARVRQGLTLEVDIYRGAAVVHSATDMVGVTRLRRAIVAGNGSSLITLAPLVINPADAWDRKFLGTAIELDAALSARSRGLTMQIANDSADVVTKVIDVTGFKDLTLLQNQPVGEIVVAAELARAAHLGDAGVDAALKLRSEGASWGLIALEQGVHALPPVFAGIDSVVVPVANTVDKAVTALPPLDTTPNIPATPTVKVPTTTPKVQVTQPSTVVTTPPVTEPAPPTNPVNTLVDGLDNLVGGLLGH